ncbi:MAG: HEAT repeat domain-containing protein [Verrucomicrobiae bacterium]|nr:HEAT repeat domain-containing protein [Verrucomicrobiae bacterium]
MKLTLLCQLGLTGFWAALTVNGAEFKFPTQTFTVPNGFEVRLVAAPELVPRPVSAAFDDAGRLYVTDSSGSNEKPELQLANPDHRILCLEDTNGDGTFDKITVFAEQVMFPEGCLWYDGSVYVAAPPSIWKFTDTDGDGVAEKREEWFQGKTLTGCANDLHGPYLGPDGYLYWTKGAFAEQTHKLGDGRTLNDRAAHIYRARPDGSNLDVVMSGGMDNPVEVAFTPEGEAIFTSTFIDFSQPGFRDGIAHAVYGGVFGKIHDVIEDGRVKRTSPKVMQPFYQAGPSAECGLVRYESAVFGEDYRDNYFATSFNLRKVTRHILRPNGATYLSATSDFLVSDNTDFHPTDVLEAPDGSLIVVDTGGWYKLCCPSSQLAKPDVLGGIYRVRRTGTPRMEDPCGLTIRWDQADADELVKYLEDQRPFVCHRAIQELGKRGDAAMPALTNYLAKSSNLSASRLALLALVRIGSPNAAAALWGSLARTNAPGITDQAGRDSLRQTQFKALSVLRASPPNEAAQLALEFALACEEPAIRRVAAELAGRIGDADRTFALLRAVAEWGSDPLVAHSATYALIEINSPTILRRELARYGMESSNPLAQANSSRVLAAGLIALDQMDAGDLQPQDVIPWLGSPDAELRKTAAWVASHHPNWGGALAGFFRERLTSQDLSEADRAGLEQQLAQFAADGAIQKLVAERLTGSNTDSATRQMLLRTMAAANLKAIPADWISPVNTSLGSKEEAIVRSAVVTARVLAQAKSSAPDFSTTLLAIATNSGRPADLRLEALAALPGGLRSVEPGLLEFLSANLHPEIPVARRSAATSVLAKAKLSEAQLLTLADSIRTTGPLEVSRLLAAFEQSNSEPVGLSLVTALGKSKGLSGVRPDTLRTLAAKYPATVQKSSGQLLAQLDVDEAGQKARLEELLATLPKGDIRRGQTVFNSEQTACASCHKIGYVGGTVGPDLTNISQVRTERDLLEAIVYPSASFVRSYEPVMVLTRSDEEYSGVLRKDAADEIVIATGPTTEVRIERSDIVEMRPGAVSVMPGGLDEQLTKQQLADLVAFLKNTKR